MYMPGMAICANGNAGSQLAVVVNASDPQSVLIAEYYKAKRNIPDENIIAVNFSADDNVLAEDIFESVYKEIKSKTPEKVQFYALAWSKPFRVGCMSVTSAMTFGYDEKYCAEGCKPTEASAYFNIDSRFPYDDLGIRPSMMLAGSDNDQVYAMIDRGVRSDGSHPSGTAYLVSTTNKARNVRAATYPAAVISLGERIRIQIINADTLEDRADVMFYFTGLPEVDAIDSNKYMDGAIADHLTSAGGRLFGSRQMSILRWIDAGVTASYGTVVEPCAFPQKFPYPGIVIDRYTAGETLIEAYWKSVAWPGQGVFIGEPLATPYARQ